MYSASVGGSVRRSADHGATWTAANAGLPSAIYALAMDAGDANTLYAGGFAAGAGATGVGAYKTTDAGDTWTPLTATTGQIVSVLTADVHIPGRVFLGSFGGGILRSVDGGSNWVRLFSGTAAVTSITIDFIDSNIVYASTLAGIVKTTDGGATWTRLSALPPSTVWAVVSDPLNHNILFAAAGGQGVWRSTDAGATWSAAGTPGGVVYAVTLVPGHTGIVLAATSDGIWRSRDDALNWRATTLSGQMVFSLTSGSDDRLYAGTTSGIAVSGDAGISWENLDSFTDDVQAFSYAVTVDPNVPGKLFVSTLGSTARISRNGGISWSDVDTTFTAREPRKINVDPTDSKRVYAGSFVSGLFKSTDGGKTWSRRDFGSGNAYVWVPVIDPVSPNIVYAGTSGEGLFKSDDYGETWSVVPGLPTVVQGVTIDPRDDHQVFAATSGGVFRSTDRGQTWTNVLARPAWNVTIVGGDSHVVYATSKNAGVFRSVDDGSHWDAINVGITNLLMGRAAPVIVSREASDVVYVGSEGGGGVYKSIDGGDTWVPVNLGLSDTVVFGLAADPRRRDVLYVSGPHGIFVTRTGGQ